MKKYFLIFIFIFCAFVGINNPQAIFLSAESASENWIDYADVSWYVEGQTEFEINQPEQLAGVALVSQEGVDFSGILITLASDIDLSGKEWTPIPEFCGNFNGNNKIISNMKITNDSVSAKALFAWAGACYIHDLTIKDAVIGGNATFASALVANRLNSNSVVKNVIVDGLQINVSNTDTVYAAGLVANSYCTQIINCEVKNSNISVSGGNVGGVVGYTSGWDNATSTNPYIDMVTYNENPIRSYYAGNKVNNVTITSSGLVVSNLGGVVGTDRGNDSMIVLKDSFVKNFIINSYGNEKTYSGGVIGQNVGGLNKYEPEYSMFYGIVNFENNTTQDITINSSNTNDSSLFGGFAGNIGHKAVYHQNNVVNVNITATNGVAGGYAGSATATKKSVCSITDSTVSGTINAPVSAGFLAYGDNTAEECELYLNNVTNNTNISNPIITQGIVVASVGNTYYSTVANAIGACEQDEKILIVSRSEITDDDVTQIIEKNLEIEKLLDIVVDIPNYVYWENGTKLITLIQLIDKVAADAQSEINALTCLSQDEKVSYYSLIEETVVTTKNNIYSASTFTETEAAYNNGANAIYNLLSRANTSNKLIAVENITKYVSEAKDLIENSSSFSDEKKLALKNEIVTAGDSAIASINNSATPDEVQTAYSNGILEIDKIINTMNPDNTVLIIVLISSVLVVLVIIGVYVWCCFRKKKKLAKITQ